MSSRRDAAGINSNLALQHITHSLESLRAFPLDTIPDAEKMLWEALQESLTRMIKETKQDQEGKEAWNDAPQREVDLFQDQLDQIVTIRPNSAAIQSHRRLCGQHGGPNNNSSTLASGAPASVATQDIAWFHQFTRLPPELRIMIWELALPQNLIANFTFPKECGPYRFFRLVSAMRPPSVAQVCRESREVACKTGGLVPIKNAKFVSISRSSESVTYRAFQWSWIDPARDRFGRFFLNTGMVKDYRDNDSEKCAYQTAGKNYDAILL